MMRNDEVCLDIVEDAALCSSHTAEPAGRSCECCQKKFRSLYRRPSTCQECGLQYCRKCIEASVCAGCAVLQAIRPLIDWAAEGSTAPFDLPLASATLGSLAERGDVRERLSERRNQWAGSSGAAGGQAVELAELEAPSHPLLAAPAAAVAEWGPALLRLSPALAQLRFEVVPQRVGEEVFWQRFFHEAACALKKQFMGVDLQAELLQEMEQRLQVAYGEPVCMSSGLQQREFPGLPDACFAADELAAGA